jgi:hypothetical protein
VRLRQREVRGEHGQGDGDKREEQDRKLHGGLGGSGELGPPLD